VADFAHIEQSLFQEMMAAGKREGFSRVPPVEPILQCQPSCLRHMRPGTHSGCARWDCWLSLWNRWSVALGCITDAQIRELAETL